MIRHIVMWNYADGLFESEDALVAYIIHPEHKRVGEFVRAVTKDRACVDYNSSALR
ncbi:MAG: Dabb family protein [Oscillospiraceae bacterium]|nr:Dabb family protein [Oscillospiraceae bacterium]